MPRAEARDDLFVGSVGESDGLAAACCTPVPMVPWALLLPPFPRAALDRCCGAAVVDGDTVLGEPGALAG